MLEVFSEENCVYRLEFPEQVISAADVLREELI